jgi:SAM-dependent methyltransferase
MLKPEAVRRRVREAEMQLAHGNPEGALTTLQRLIDSGCSDRPAFQLYRKLYRRLRGHDLAHEQVFDFIYRSAEWGQDPQTGLGTSGHGSTLAASNDYRNLLTKFLIERKIASVVDVGCGDWQIGREIDWSGIAYLGVDVSSVVLSRVKMFESDNIRFVEGDARTMALPDADLLLLKDVLQHWSNTDIQRFVPRISRFRFALITNDYAPFAEGQNKDINGGECRSLDLAAPPFSIGGSILSTFRPLAGERGQREGASWKQVFLVDNTASLQ